MVCLLQICALLIVVLINSSLVKGKPTWTFDIVSLDVENRSPDFLFLDLHVTRPYRGVFAMSGICEFKQDITDQTYMMGSAYYSRTGADYVKTSFFIPKSNLTTFMNNYYKQLTMESLLNCTDNAPLIEDKFVAPLTKRRVHVNNCLFSNENMPSHMQSGYYKIILEYRNEMDTDLIIVVKIEPNW